MEYFDLKEVEDSIKVFFLLGVDVMFIELDILVLFFFDENNMGVDVGLFIVL